MKQAFSVDGEKGFTVTAREMTGMIEADRLSIPKWETREQAILFLKIEIKSVPSCLATH